MRIYKQIPILATTCLAVCCGGVTAQVTTDDIRQGARDRVHGTLAEQEQQAYARSLLVQFETRVNQAKTLIEQVEQRHAAYRTQMDNLLVNDDGKRLGRKGQAVAMHFIGYMDQSLIEPSELAAKKTFVEQMLSFLERAKSGPAGYVPQPERVEEADDAYLWARSRSMTLSESESWLAESLGSLDHTTDVAGDPTLKEQIDAYRAALRQEWLVLQSRGKEAARQEAAPLLEENARIAELESALLEANQKLSFARQQNEQQRIDFEMRMEQRRVELRERLAASQREMDERLASIDREDKLAEAERMRRDAEANAEARDIREDAQRTELVARCNSPQVQRDLAPFLAEGIWQPGDYKTNARLDMAPMSYSKIQSDGALADSVEGLQLFLEIVNRKGCHPRGNRNSSYYRHTRKHLDTDRPKWGYTSDWNELTRNQIEEAQRVQTLLRELGPTLVELGMLSE
tara:strand:- start:372 stop:1748 length:1377 start_codon:yes stop_codon:yes gene_type:complete